MKKNRELYVELRLLELSGKVGLRVCRHDGDEESTKTNHHDQRQQRERERESGKL
jgi:hypothetical protein